MTGPMRVDAAVVVSGPWLAAVRRAVLLAEHARRRNGMPPSTEYAALLAAVESAMSATGQADVRPEVVLSDSGHEYITVTEAAGRLGISTRQCRRIADRLGGRKRGGRWFIDGHAVAEHHTGATT